MGPWLASTGMLVLLLGQVPAQLPGAVPAAIEDAVTDLRSSEFSLRRRASRVLWEHGLAAEPALQRAARSGDREVRLQAERILSDFRYGILPHVPDEINALIRRFRDGDANQRAMALQALADQEEFDRLQHLVQLEPEAEVRRQLLVYLMQNPRAVEHFLEFERLQRLIAAVGADQEQSWRQTILAQLLFSEIMVRRLSETGKLDVLMKVVEAEPSADVRREMLSRLFQNSGAVASLVQEDRLDFLFQLIVKEPQLRVRGEWIQRMLSMPDAIAPLAEDDRLERFVRFARENVQEDRRDAVLQQTLQHPQTVRAILDKRGVEGLVALASAEDDPAARGRLLASLAASPAVRQVLNEEGQRDLLLQLARQQKEPAARNEYMKSVIASGWGYSLFQTPASRQAVWEMIKAEPAATDQHPLDWRGDAIHRMLTMSSAEDVLRGENEAAWLLQFLRDEASAEQRTRILERLLSDYRMQAIVHAAEHFETLLALIRMLPDDRRGDLLGRLISSAAVQRLAAAGQTERVVALADDEPHAGARRAYLQRLFRDHAAMSALLEAGLHDPLWNLVQAEQDPLQHAILRGDFYSTSSVVQRLQAGEQLESLIDFARQQTGPARHEYLLRLFRNTTATGLLIDGGHYQTLFALADSDADQERRAALLSVLYVQPKVLEQLAANQQLADTLEFAEQHLGGNELRSFLQQICQQQTVVGALVEQGQLERILLLVRQQKEDHFQVHLLRSVLAAPPVVQHYAQQGQLKQLYEQIGDVSSKMRHQIWESLLQRSENLAAVVEQDGVDDLVVRLREEDEPARRGMLVGRLLVQQPVVDDLVAKKRLDTVLGIVREETEAASRHALLSTLFSHPGLVAALLEAEFFDQLHELVSSESDPGQRSQLLARLLSNHRTVEHLVAGGRVDLLLSVARQQDDTQIRRNVLTQILASPAAVKALIDHEQFDRLYRLCRLEPDATARRRLLATLLNSRLAVERLAGSGGLQTTVHEVLGETDEAARRSLLQIWLTHSQTLEALLDQGLFPTLLEATRADSDPAQRRRLLLPLLSHPLSVRQLAATGRIDLLLQLLGEELQASGNAWMLHSLLSNSAAISAIAASGHLGDLLDLADRQPLAGPQASWLSHWVANLATLKYAARYGQLDRLADMITRRGDAALRRQFIQRLVGHGECQRALAHRRLADLVVEGVRAETEDSSRQLFANSILSQPLVLQHLIAHGQAEFLRDLAGWLPDEERRRQRLQPLLYAPSGLVASHLQRGETEQAEQLLTEYADDDPGRLRLASYWLLSGQIDQQIAELQTRQGSEPPSPDNARLLTYLWRASGDLDAARAAAESTGDPGLLKALLVEMGRWSEVAELQRSHPCPLPIPWPSSLLTTEPRQRVERLSLQAAYERLAGDRAGCDATLDQVLELAASQRDDGPLQWWCVQALLLNGRVDDGLTLLAESDPVRAFDFYAFRNQYDRALGLLGWQAGDTPQRAWLDALPVQGRDADQQAIHRVEVALKVARTLHALGQRQEADQLLDLLKRYAAQQSDNNSSTSPRRQCWERLSQGLLSLGDEAGAWELAAQTLLSAESPPMLLSRLYSGRHQEASDWWRFFRRHHAGEPATETFARVHRVMAPGAADDVQPFADLVQAAAQTAADLLDDSLRRTVIRTCLQRGRLDLAEPLIEPADSADADIAAPRADLLWRNRRWDDAAAAYHGLWQDDHQQLAALYLSGEALQRAGQPDEGRQRMELADQLALDSRARCLMARELAQKGLAEQAEQQLQRVLRTAPFEHWEWHEAARLLGDAAVAHDPAVAAQWLELSLLDDLRSYFHLLRDADYLRTPAVIHRLQAAAAIDAGDFEAAAASARLAVKAAPGETEICEQLVPRLEQAGQHQAADELFELQFDQHLQWVEAWPGSARLHNNLAWLAARCDRRLDQALHHAEEAVQREPANSGYLDTLAEVHFRRGDRQAAIDYARRALALEPDSAMLKSQLERFEKE